MRFHTVNKLLSTLDIDTNTDVKIIFISHSSKTNERPTTATLAAFFYGAINTVELLERSILTGPAPAIKKWKVKAHGLTRRWLGGLRICGREWRRSETTMRWAASSSCSIDRLVLFLPISFSLSLLSRTPTHTQPVFLFLLKQCIECVLWLSG